jgi:circadian clock protein KaiC
VNTASLGFDFAGLENKNLLAIDFVHIDREEICETGEYDLEGLFVRLGFAIDRVKARRVVLDGVDTLFAGIPNQAILRSELRRLFAWLKARHQTCIVTAERGERSLTRSGIEEYVSDCVIVLEQRVEGELATRRLRVVKYRGSTHGTNEYPFLIEDKGLTLAPITSLSLAHTVSSERVSTGIPSLDEMLGDEGFFKGTSVLLSGGPGTGKTSIGAQFVLAATQRGERCLTLAFEESEPQLVRNMRSIGLDLQKPIDDGLLSIQSVRPTTLGLEMHLTRILHLVQEEKPSVVVADPLSALESGGTWAQAHLMVLRLIDFLKTIGSTALYISVQRQDGSSLNISSLMDTWITVKNLHGERELKRQLYIVKSRGMAHSADMREFVIGPEGLRVLARKPVT